MIKTGLDFAPGTSDECKKLIAKIPPESLVKAYRNARRESGGSNDIVLVISDQSPDISGGTRAEYVSHLRRILGRRAAELKIYDHSAHEIMQMPRDSEAMWIVVDTRQSDWPIMCVVYALPYEVSAAAVN
jgi:hypothetical protein